ncbi:MAG TPA: hypothetical protein VMG80_07460, partial [Solirubrobacteraceae bacterium]|nr:hypothetical protein [Solirubrobacteraceae bacterium]
NRPTGGALTGGYQLRIDALDPALAPDESPSLPGFTLQFANGQPGSLSVLGVTPTDIFNTYLGPGGARPLVPVTRLDLSGYGESLFSDWRNPYLDAVAVSQARFDVLIGRTSHEVVQVRTKLFFYGVDLVRTLTMERKNTGVVIRRDSGWKAVGDGAFTFSGSAIVTHPGVIRRITNVANVRETGQVVTVDGYELATVYFDGDLEIDGVVGLVPAKDQLGFIQVTAGAYLPPTAYADALAALGPLGGTVDTTLRVGSGPIAARVHRVDVAATSGAAGPEFAVAAWTGPIFPEGGEWLFLRVDGPTAAPQPVPPAQGVPLIRAGAAGGPPPNSPYRFADPQDLGSPSNPAHDYGLVHATGTQRVIFPRPRIEATDTHRIVSTEIPRLADPYVLGTADGPFPALAAALPFPNNSWAFAVDPAGDYKLELPANPFAIGYVGRRTLKQAGSVKGDVDYTGAAVTYVVDTAQAKPWSFALDGAVKIMNTTALGDIIALKTDIRAAADKPGAEFQHPNLKLGGALTIVQDMLTILADLGIQGVMSAQMTNDWSLKVKLTVPFVDATGEALQIPPLVPNPQVKFDDSGVEVELTTEPNMDKAQFALVGQPMFALQELPGAYAVGLIKFSIQISTEDGTTYGLLIGYGFAFEIDLTKVLKLKGLFAVTFFGFIGDTTLGFGIGFVAKLGVAIEPLFSVEVYLEGQLAVVAACRGTGNDTTYGAAKLTFGVEISVCLVFSISFEVETTASRVITGPDGAACPLPDVLPSAT